MTTYNINDENLSLTLVPQLANLNSRFSGQLNPNSGEFILDEDYGNAFSILMIKPKEGWIPFTVTRYTNDSERNVWFNDKEKLATHPNKSDLSIMLDQIYLAINNYDNAKYVVEKNNFCKELLSAKDAEALVKQKYYVCHPSGGEQYLLDVSKKLEPTLSRVPAILKGALPVHMSAVNSIISAYFFKPIEETIKELKKPEVVTAKQLQIKIEAEQAELEHVGRLMDMYPSTP